MDYLLNKQFGVGQVGHFEQQLKTWLMGRLRDGDKQAAGRGTNVTLLPETVAMEQSKVLQ